jgi:hypothetical protein
MSVAANTADGRVARPLVEPRGEFRGLTADSANVAVVCNVSAGFLLRATIFRRNLQPLPSIYNGTAWFALAPSAKPAAPAKLVSQPLLLNARAPRAIYVVIASGRPRCRGWDTTARCFWAQPFTPSIILAVFRLVWAGSGADHFSAKRGLGRPGLRRSCLQPRSATAHLRLPYWLDLFLGPWYNFDVDLMRCIRTISGDAFVASLPARTQRRRIGGLPEEWCLTAGHRRTALARMIPPRHTRPQQLLIGLSAAGAVCDGSSLVE